jgi:hypothetical protein
MAKKPKEKPRNAGKTKRALQTEPKVKQSRDEESNPWDFGGMPNRDLKKNLGCG